MVIRYLSATTTGLFVTFAILFAMQGLIKLQPGAASDGPDNRPTLLSMVRLPKPPPAPLERDITPEDLTNLPPPPSERPTLEGLGQEGIPVHRGQPTPVPDLPTDIGQPDGPLIAVVRVQPTYPPVASQRGLEGWVDVRFDVTPNGLVTNVQVVRSSNPLFEKAAVRAAERFRFKAPVIDGVPRQANGIEYRFRFDMDM